MFVTRNVSFVFYFSKKTKQKQNKTKQSATTPLFAFHGREGTGHFSCLGESG